MKIVIDIPKIAFESVKSDEPMDWLDAMHIISTIQNGIPLEEELEKVKAKIENMWIKSSKDLRTGEVIYENLCEHSEVLDILNKHISELKGEQNNDRCGYADSAEDFEEYSRIICQLPPVTQPKIGRWITTRTFMHDGEYYCDRCKCDAPNNEKWDYCPNCGAKMESEGITL